MGNNSSTERNSGSRLRQSVLSSWVTSQSVDKSVGENRKDVKVAEVFAEGVGTSKCGRDRRMLKGRSRRQKEAVLKGSGSDDTDSQLVLAAMGRSMLLQDDCPGSGDWDRCRRVKLYEVINKLVADPKLPELTFEEAKAYVCGLKMEGIEVGGFFPSDVVVAARSLKLTRRMFHVEASSICSGQGLWLNKGVRVAKGEFVGFYVGWIYTESCPQSVWDPQYMDNTYSLGLTGIKGRNGDEGLRIHARDNVCGRQDQIFTLGHANEWIWENDGRRGNMLRFGKDGMVFSQKMIQSSKARVEVTIGFGKEGAPFGGWATYTITLAQRLCLLSQRVWLQIQGGLSEETRSQVQQQGAEMLAELTRITFKDLPILRESRSHIAVLIAGVELQDANEEWGSICFDESLSLVDNLRKFVLHPAVRERCTFRLADAPGRAVSRGPGDVGFWDKIIAKERRISRGRRTSARCWRLVEGMERLDGIWTWCVPIPLRRDDVSMNEPDGHRGVEERTSCEVGESAAAKGVPWLRDRVISGNNSGEGGVSWDGSRQVGQTQLLLLEGSTGDNSVETESYTGVSEVEGLRTELEVGDRGREEGTSSILLNPQNTWVDDELVREDESNSGVQDQVEDSTNVCENMSEIVIGSRWIYDCEECEICKVVSAQEFEVVFADSRTAIVLGPFSYPEEDDFLGWPTRSIRAGPTAGGLMEEVTCFTDGLDGTDSQQSNKTLGLYQEELDVMGFSGGVRELLDQIGIKMTTPSERKIRIATWNASGLHKLSKVRYVMALMELAQIDILCIQDTRIEPGQWKDELEKEMKRLMGPGSSVFIATVASRLRGSRGPNVGGQIMLKSSRVRSSCRFYSDDSALGMVCWIDMQVGSHDVRIVSVYVPPAHGEKIEESDGEVLASDGKGDAAAPDMEYSGALAIRVRQFVQQSDRWEGCIDYVLGVAQLKIDQHLRTPGGVVFCVGDFNASGTTTGKRSVNGTMAEWAESVGLRNCMSFRGIECPFTFFRGVEGVSAIDHVLFTQRAGIVPVTHRVLNDSLWLSLSNHSPLTVDFDMPGMTEVYVSRRGRRVSHVRKRMDIRRVKLNVEEVEMSRDVLDYRKYIVDRLKVSQMQGSLDDQLELVVRVTKAALRAVHRKRRRTDWWSPITVALTANMIAVQEIERYAGGHGRRRWDNEVEWSTGLSKVVQNWRRQLARIGKYNGEGCPIDLAEVSGTGPGYWVAFDKVPMADRGAIVKEELRRLRYLLRRHERSELCQRRQKIMNTRLFLRHRGLHLRELKEIMGGRTSQFSMDYLVDSGLYVVDEKQIHNQVSAHFRQWFARKERDWGFLAMESDDDRLWTDKDYFVAQHAQSNIPLHLLEVVWTAMRPKYVEDDAHRNFIADINEPPTLAEFERELAATSTHSAGGPTGITYNAMMGWPAEVLKKVHSILEQFWQDKQIPRCWKWRWLVPIPKSHENITLDDLRPLMLTDVVRKVWVSVLVHKIQAHLESRGLLSSAQHGTLSNRGTEGALVQFRNILEEARESCTNVYLSSWDVVKAFDRLQKNVQIKCWTRLGIPIEIARYLVLMDTEGSTMVRTPYAEDIWDRMGISGFSTGKEPQKAAAFSPTSGTGQGNIDSPLMWTAFMDILLDSLATVEGDQFYIRTSNGNGEGLAVVQDISYVDDLISLTSRLEGLQRKANVVCAFFSIFGMDSARIKFRTFRVEWGAELTQVNAEGTLCRLQAESREFIYIYKDGWTARKVWVQTHRSAKPFKYLGVLFDLSNSDGASLEKAVSIAKKGISQVCQSMGDFELRVEALLFCVYPKLLYSAKFASWPLRRYLDIDKIFSAAFRRILGLRRGFPEDLLYAPWGFRGVGIARFSDEAQMAKLAIVSRGSTAEEHTREATMGLVLRGFRQQNMKPAYTQAATMGREFISLQPLFVRSIVEWLAEGDMSLRKGGVEVIDKSHTLLADYCKSQSSPLTIDECARLEAFGISALGDVVMCAEYIEDTYNRRGRSKTRDLEKVQRRGLEVMRVITARGSYDILRYVRPVFVVRWIDKRTEEMTYAQICLDIAGMVPPPRSSSVRWIQLPSELSFLYDKLPPRAPELDTILLARDQCWATMNGQYRMGEGYVWEVLGFEKSLVCIRVWRVDGGVMRRQVRPGVKVRLNSPSHGAASLVWVSREELLCGEEWGSIGNVYRVLLGPDENGYGVCREVISIYTQPRLSFFSPEMEVPLLSDIHQHTTWFDGTNMFTDGSVVQESNPVINVLIPAPSINRMLGHPPKVAGSLIARPDAGAAHVTNVAIRAEQGQLAGCANSYDIEMVMLTLAVLFREQLETRDPTPIWSDCKSAVDKATLIDAHRIRQSGHKEHGLLLRRMYHSRHKDTTLLKHVRGHPERRLPKGQRWPELSGSDAGIYLADKIANAQMTADEKFVWENDGSLLTPLSYVTVADILSMFASIDLWSIVGTDGIPILESPLHRVQSARFHRYLQRRDRGRSEQWWSQYIITGPAAAFGHERLYHRRTKVTKVVFNWYSRAEHLTKTVRTGNSEVVPTEKISKCQLCGKDMGGDTEQHLYTLCDVQEIIDIRKEAVQSVKDNVDASTGLVQLVLAGFQTLFTDPRCQHKVWKGMLSRAQVHQLAQVIPSEAPTREVTQLIMKRLRECMKIGGDALLAIRKVAWTGGGPVPLPTRAGGKQCTDRVTSGQIGSIAAALGIMTPLDEVKWELRRRRRYREKAQSQELLMAADIDTVKKEKLGEIGGEATEEGKTWLVH